MSEALQTTQKSWCSYSRLQRGAQFILNSCRIARTEAGALVIMSRACVFPGLSQQEMKPRGMCVKVRYGHPRKKSDQTSSFQKWTDQTENLAMLQNLPQVSVSVEGLVRGMPLMP